MKLVTFFIALIFIIPVYGQRKKEDIEIVPAYSEGVVYTLPRTGVRINVVAKGVDFIPGPFANFANDLLGIPDAKTQASSNWIIEDIRLELFSEPDPEKTFKTMGSIASLVSLSPNGCLAGINTPSNGQEGNVVITNQLLIQKISDSKLMFTNFSNKPFFMAGDSTNKFHPTRVSMEQKAAEAASTILQCRTARFEISSGLLDEYHPDGKAYEESLKQLREIELEYLSLFVGKSTVGEVKMHSFEFVPSNKSTKGEIVFRFSEKKGVLDKSDLSGKPVMLEVDKLESLTSVFSGKISSKNPDAGKSGIYYNMPGVADLALLYELKTIATARVTFAQFGSVAPVPEDLLDGGHQLEFYPETGGIKNITVK